MLVGTETSDVLMRTDLLLGSSVSLVDEGIRAFRLILKNSYRIQILVKLIHFECPMIPFGRVLQIIDPLRLPEEDLKSETNPHIFLSNPILILKITRMN